MRKLQTVCWVVAISWLYSCSPNGENKYILNENFDSNEIGWPEEFTSSHETEIRNGVYFIESKSEDTIKVQSSVGPQKISFLFNLPKHYEITTAFKKSNGSQLAEYGIILTSASLSYRFSFNESGDVNASEYDYNTDSATIVMEEKYNRSNEVNDSEVRFRIDINGRALKLYLNDKFVDGIKVKTKQWDDIRLFTSTQSEVSIDYLRIKKLQ